MASKRTLGGSMVWGILALALLSGCGGGGGGGHRDAAKTQGVGQVAVAVHFPQTSTGQVGTADLPQATRSVVIGIYDPADPNGRPLVPLVVIRRQPGQDVVRATINGIPAGDVIVRVKAFDVDDPLTASAVSIAEAETMVRVVAGRTTSVTLTTNRLATTLSIEGPDTVYLNRDASYVATAYDADGNIILGTLEPHFSSSNPSVLDVQENGQARGVAVGDATVNCTARWNGVRDLHGSLDVAVLWPPPSRIDVSSPNSDPSAPQHVVIDNGQNTSVTATVYDDQGNPVPNYPVTWQSSDDSVVTIDETDRNNLHTHSAGVATITVTADNGVDSCSTDIEVAVLPSDAELLAHLQQAQDPNTGGFLEAEGSGNLLDLHFYADVASAFRVLHGSPTNPNALADYIKNLYDPETNLYFEHPAGAITTQTGGGMPTYWAAQAAVRTFLILAPDLGSLPNIDRTANALAQWAGMLVSSGPTDCWGFGEVVVAVCSVLGPSDWGDPYATPSNAFTVLTESELTNGSFHIGEVLHTYWALAAFEILGTTPPHPSRTLNFLSASQTSEGYFGKGPGRTDWDWLHEPEGVAAMYILGQDPPDPWALTKWLARAYADQLFGPSEPTLAYAQMASLKKLLAHDPTAIDIWVHHNYTGGGGGGAITTTGLTARR